MKANLSKKELLAWLKVEMLRRGNLNTDNFLQKIAELLDAEMTE